MASDLAAAYLELSAATDHPELLVRALEATNKALALEPALAEARFNRALLLEKLHLDSAARNSWKDYLKLDDRSGWATEVAGRIARLSAPPFATLWLQRRPQMETAATRGDRKTLAAVARTFRQPMRTYAEERLLAGWAETSQRDPAAADRLLAQLSVIASVLSVQSGDEMLAATVAVLSFARLHHPAAERVPVARAHQVFAAALAAFQDRRFREAKPLFAAASDLLAQAGSPFSFWAEFYVAVCDYQAADYAGAMTRLTVLRERVAARHFPVLSGRIWWITGLINVVRGRLTDSLAAYHQAATLFAATGEQENLAAINSLIAQDLQWLGAEDSSWRYRLRALAGADRIVDPLRRQTLFQGMAMASLAASSAPIALAFQEEAVSAARSTAKPDLLADSLLRRAAILDNLGQLGPATSDLQWAAKVVSSVREPTIQRIVATEIQVVAAEARLAKEPRTAAALFTQILQDYRETHFLRELARIRLQRARAYLALKEDQRAAADLRAAVDLIEKMGAGIETLGFRELFLTQARATFDTLVELYAVRRQVSASLDAAERSRAQCLLTLGERMAPAKAQTLRPDSITRSLTIGSIQAELPAHVALLEYEVLPTKLLIWTVTRQRLLLTAVQCPQATLSQRIARLQGAIQGEALAPELNRASAALFELLIRPILGRLAGYSQLILIPDKILFSVPFAALRDERSGKFLVELCTLGQAPSASIYVRGLARIAKSSALPPSTVVVVGDPAIDRSVSLPELAAARDEARSIAALYPHSTLLTGGKATESAFFAAARTADVLHVAAHALTTDGSETQSGILFAAGTAPASDAPPLSCLSTVRLIFLSACDTASGRLSASEGPMSSARFFLGKGVPAVIASLWKVGDQEASSLAVPFHRRYRAGVAAFEALRQTQLELIRSQTPARTWAAFIATGTAN